MIGSTVNNLYIVHKSMQLWCECVIHEPLQNANHELEIKWLTHCVYESAIPEMIGL